MFKDCCSAISGDIVAGTHRGWFSCHFYRLEGKIPEDPNEFSMTKAILLLMRSAVYAGFEFEYDLQLRKNQVENKNKA